MRPRPANRLKPKPHVDRTPPKNPSSSPEHPLSSADYEWAKQRRRKSIIENVVLVALTTLLVLVVWGWSTSP